MAADTGTNPFADCALLTETIRALTVASAKSLIKDVNAAPETACQRLALSGNKPELINRLVSALNARRSQGDIRGYQRFRDLIAKYKGPIATPAYRNLDGGMLNGGGSRLGGIPANKAQGVASSSYSPLAAAVASSSSTLSRPLSSAGSTKINFRPSPFWEIKQFVCYPVTCPEAPTNADRKNAQLFITLTPDQVDLLKKPNHEIKLFCTTSEAHAASLSGRNPAPIEFPLTCEARVNGTPLSTNLRGSKKNVGRVPPPNLNKDKALVLKDGRPNRIELTYTNAPKRYALVAAICTTTSAETLVEQLRQKQFRSKADVLSKMRKEAEDDDIEAGAATMSLKCPFSYMRMTTPCRSNFCPHIQCFDAYSFFSVNEQTPSWLCPICNRIIKPEDVVMDGYVDDILKRVPHDEESVIVEPDGSWRTPDGKISSDGNTTQPTPTTGTPIADRLQGRESAEDVKAGIRSSNGNGASASASAIDEIVLLDSPSPPSAPVAETATSAAPPGASAPTARPETNGASRESHARGFVPIPVPNTASPPMSSAPAPRPLPPQQIVTISSSSSQPGSSARNSPAVQGEVIDLTLDSDDDEPGPSVPARPIPTTGTTSIPMTGRSSLSNPYAATPARPLPSVSHAGSSTSRAEATPEDEQIRRPGKRSRYEPPVPTTADPRLANGRRPYTTSTTDRRNLPASYLDMGSRHSGNSTNHVTGANAGAASSSNTNGSPRSAEDSNQGPSSSSTSVGGRRDDSRGGTGETNDDWMDTNTQEHERYFDDEDWWGAEG